MGNIIGNITEDLPKKRKQSSVALTRPPKPFMLTMGKMSEQII